MLARLLIVALILVGQFPLRVCTCGAAHAHFRQPPVQPVPDTPRPDGRPAVETDPDVPHHHHDCPAAHAPRPCLKPAPLAVAQTAPDDSAVAVFALPDSELAAVVFAEPPPVRPPPVPLFVTFRTLRN